MSSVSTSSAGPLWTFLLQVSFDFSQTLAGFLTAVIATSPLPSCSLTVQFQLIQ
ncbi:MAG TPA: hypothetical protein VMS37_11190 [Verrucomicrobiae bacterium]|nr:hypothetical protein [Verrucomicrobiae bacterium]